jgi:hypothetical protein
LVDRPRTIDQAENPYKTKQNSIYKTERHHQHHLMKKKLTSSLGQWRRAACMWVTSLPNVAFFEHNCSHSLHPNALSFFLCFWSSFSFCFHKLRPRLSPENLYRQLKTQLPRHMHHSCSRTGHASMCINSG